MVILLEWKERSARLTGRVGKVGLGGPGFLQSRKTFLRAHCSLASFCPIAGIDETVNFSKRTEKNVSLEVQARPHSPKIFNLGIDIQTISQ